MIKVKVNREIRTFPIGSTILDLLKIEKINPIVVGVEVNGRRLAREEYEGQIIFSRDCIEYYRTCLE